MVNPSVVAGFGFLGEGVRTSVLDLIGDLFVCLRLNPRFFLCGDSWFTLNTFGERADLLVGEGVEDMVGSKCESCW